MKKIVSLKDYLMTLGVKKSFFIKKPWGNHPSKVRYYSDVNLYGGGLCFVSNSLLSKIKIGTSFLRLKQVFPKKKIIKMCWSDDLDISPNTYGYDYYFENGSFEDAIDRHRKFCIELERAYQKLLKKTDKKEHIHIDYNNTKIDFESICRKNNLVPISRQPDLPRGGPRLAHEMCEAYFHHEYNTSLGFDSTYYDTHSDFFLVREIIKYSKSITNRIYFVNIHSLNFVEDIYVQI